MIALSVESKERIARTVRVLDKTLRLLVLAVWCLPLMLLASLFLTIGGLISDFAIYITRAITSEAKDGAQKAVREEAGDDEGVGAGKE